MIFGTTKWWPSQWFPSLYLFFHSEAFLLIIRDHRLLLLPLTQNKNLVTKKLHDQFVSGSFIDMLFALFWRFLKTKKYIWNEIIFHGYRRVRSLKNSRCWSSLSQNFLPWSFPHFLCFYWQALRWFLASISSHLKSRSRSAIKRRIFLFS